MSWGKYVPELFVLGLFARWVFAWGYLSTLQPNVVAACLDILQYTALVLILPVLYRQSLQPLIDSFVLLPLRLLYGSSDVKLGKHHAGVSLFLLELFNEVKYRRVALPNHNLHKKTYGKLKIEPKI